MFLALCKTSNHRVICGENTEHGVSRDHSAVPLSERNVSSACVTQTEGAVDGCGVTSSHRPLMIKRADD